MSEELYSTNTEVHHRVTELRIVAGDNDIAGLDEHQSSGNDLALYRGQRSQKPM